MTVTDARMTANRSADISGSKFRADIQGLRALAVLAVLLYHASVPLIDGGFVGVDVFFVISGFLISSHLLGELHIHGRIRFREFYARRARRILPASFVVLILTAAAVIVFSPPVLVPNVLRHVAATAAYVPNVLFAVEGTDYLAETAPSPFQHYWSLGVEEQFYAVWPLVLLAGWVLFRRRKGVGIVLFIGGVLSFAASAVLTYLAPSWAFFSLPTRAWELGLGAAVAVAQPLLVRLPAVAASMISWGGLLGLVASMLMIDATRPFPGVLALWPVFTTALVIAGGSARPRHGAEVALRSAPVQFIGRISYSLYLVHWPLIVIPAAAMGSGELEGQPAMLALALTFPLAWSLYHFVEVPFQKAEWARRHGPRRVLIVTLASGLVVGIGALGAAKVLAGMPIDAGRPAQAVTGNPSPPIFGHFVPSNMIPSIRATSGDIPSTYTSGCHLNGQEQVEPPSECKFGDTASGTVVALFGDSHAAQWFPALQKLAVDRGFRLDVYTKSSCPSVTVAMMTKGVRNSGCERWRETVIERLSANPPDRIVLSNFAHYDEFGTTGLTTKAWAAGLAQTLSSLPGNSEVSVIMDTPAFSQTPAVCLSAHVDSALECARPRSEALDAGWGASEASAARANGAQVVDLNDVLCDEARCGVVIGNRMLYRDHHHLTASYAAQLVGPLRTALGW